MHFPNEWVMLHILFNCILFSMLSNVSWADIVLLPPYRPQPHPLIPLQSSHHLPTSLTSLHRTQCSRTLASPESVLLAPQEAQFSDTGQHFTIDNRIGNQKNIKIRARFWKPIACHL